MVTLKWGITMLELQATNHLEFSSLSQIANELDLPITNVFETFLRANHEGAEFKAFIMVTEKPLEFGSWADDSSKRITRSDFDFYLGNVLDLPHTETCNGFIEIPLKTVDTMLRKGTAQIKYLKEDTDHYIAFVTPMILKGRHIYISLDDKPALINKIVRSDDDLVSPELIKTIRTEFSGDSSSLLQRLKQLEDSNRKLKTDLHYYKGLSKAEKRSAQNLLIAGLIETLLQETRSGGSSPYQKADGNLKISEMVKAAIDNIIEDENCSGTTNFRNLIPELWKQHAKKSISPTLKCKGFS